MVFQDNIPIYVQIANDIKDQIVSGKLPVGAKLGSIREYSLLYEVTTLTITRAFGMLEHQNMITTKKGVGSFVKEGAREALKVEMVEGLVEDFTRRITNMGFTGKEVLAMVQENLERRSGNE